MIKLGATFLITLFLLDCTSVGERQRNLVSVYLASDSGIDLRIRKAIESGNVIPGMNLEQIYLASGEKAKGFKTYSIWVVREDGTLTLPPYVILPSTPTALIMKNSTQFDTITDEPFVVYLDGDNRVLRVERGTANIK